MAGTSPNSSGHVESSEKRGVSRLSTYSQTPTLAPSIAPSHLSVSPSLTPSEKASPLVQEVRSLTTGLARLDNPKLQSQRYQLKPKQEEVFSRLAFQSKLERALDRRMVSQDAIYKPKKVNTLTKVAAA